MLFTPSGNSDDDFAATASKQIYKKQYYNDFISRMYDLMGDDLSYGEKPAFLIRAHNN